MLASYRLKHTQPLLLLLSQKRAAGGEVHSWPVFSIQPVLLSYSSAVSTWTWLSKQGRCNSVAGGQGSVHKRLSGEPEPWAGQTGLMELSPYALFEYVCSNWGNKQKTDAD